jgi:hypothetical protein
MSGGETGRSGAPGGKAAPVGARQQDGGVSGRLRVFPKPQMGVKVNAAICNAKYEPVQLPVVVDLRARRRRRGSRLGGLEARPRRER